MFHSPVLHFYGIVDYIRPQFEFISVIPLTRNMFHEWQNPAYICRFAVWLGTYIKAKFSYVK